MCGSLTDARTTVRGVRSHEFSWAKPGLAHVSSRRRLVPAITARRPALTLRRPAVVLRRPALTLRRPALTLRRSSVSRLPTHLVRGRHPSVVAVLAMRDLRGLQAAAVSRYQRGRRRHRWRAVRARFGSADVPDARRGPVASSRPVRSLQSGTTPCFTTGAPPTGRRERRRRDAAPGDRIVRLATRGRLSRRRRCRLLSGGARLRLERSPRRRRLLTASPLTAIALRDTFTTPGRLAQLGERRLDKAEVAGSSPASSTSYSQCHGSSSRSDGCSCEILQCRRFVA